MPDDQISLTISLYITNTISAINSISPAKWMPPSTCLLIGFLRIASMTRNTSRPPSSAGNGRRFITPRFAESRTARLSIFIHRIMVPSLLLSSYVVPIASTIPTGPLRSFIPSFPLTSSFRLRIVVRTIYFTSTAPYLTIFSPFAFSRIHIVGKS